MDLNGLRVALIGGGNMGDALVRGLLKARTLTTDQVVVTDRRAERLEHFTKTYAVEATHSNTGAVANADVVILAVKPQILDRVLQEIAKSLPAGALVISIAAGVTIEAIAAHLRPGARIVRTMPNTCAIVDEAATAIVPGEHATEADVARVHTVFDSIGKSFEVEENQLDAVTGLSGSGPAYVFMIIEALADAGVKVGLPRYHAQALAAQTVLGSAKLLLESGEHPGVLKDMVTSPGGTAIAGLHTLEEGGLRTTLINAVIAATERSRELGEQLKPPAKR
jgi:pyrroline-5-carboxylate reductase